MPCGVFHIPVTTGVVPVQLKVTFSPETCGNRPVPPCERRVAERREAVHEGLPQLISGQREDHGAVAERQHAKISPQVISRTASPAVGGDIRMSCRRRGVRVRRIDARRLRPHGVGDEVADRGLEQTRRRPRMSTDCDPITLLRSTAVLVFVLSTDRLARRCEPEREVLRDARRAAGRLDVPPAWTDQLEGRSSSSPRRCPRR